MMREDVKRVGRYAWAVALTVAGMAFGMTGCGESGPVTAAIDLKSPGMEANGELKPNVRCGWGSLWIPLDWGEVPDETKELAILLARFKNVKEGDKQKPTVLFADLVSKFKPTERKLVANVLPEGVSWSWFGENCVTSAKGQQILLEVFALDNVREREMNRQLATRLTEEALAEPEVTEGPRSPGELTEDTAAVGRLITENYTGPH